MIEFETFPKIARLRRPCTITEKLDGTNAQVVFPEDDGPMRVGSRNKWITPDDDNFGFARWAHEHETELRSGLGYGRHFGEWWGAGVNKRYSGHMKDKRFSLFNTIRWTKPDGDGNMPVLPTCVSLVPLLYVGVFSEAAIEAALDQLRTQGSVAVPGCMKPEGIVVFHSAAQVPFKITLEGDHEPKGAAGA